MVREVLAVIVVAALAACGGGDAGPTTAAATASTDSPSRGPAPSPSPTPSPPASSPRAVSTPSSTRSSVTSGAETVVPAGFERISLTVTNADGTVCELCVWRAATATERGQGLKGVTDLGDADGMAFVYDHPVTNRYWMRDTPLVLDIAWFDASGALVSTATMTPCLTGAADDCPRYGAAAPYTLALELPTGRLTELGIGSGSVAVLGDGPGCDTS